MKVVFLRNGVLFLCRFRWYLPFKRLYLSTIFFFCDK